MADTIFYSWQMDTPQRENKNLLREELSKAIATINAELGIDDAVRIDHDTKDVPGNPVIIDTILKKIAACRIFAPDVTFVAVTSDGKKVPNPNVLVELGYALEVLGDRKSLILMNEHFGSPDDLPFDIGHRRWPITYNLAPDAPKKARDAARAALQQQLVPALRDLLKETAVESREEPLPVHKNSSFLNDGDVVHKRPTGSFGGGPVEAVTWTNDSQGFIRVIPSEQKSLSRRDVDNLIENFFPMSGTPMRSSFGRNLLGGCAYVCGDDDLRAVMITQLFQSGEIWGIHQPAFVERPHLQMGVLRELYRLSLEMMVNAAKKIDLRYPLRVYLGASGIEGKSLDIAPYTIGGSCLDDEIAHEVELAPADVNMKRHAVDFLSKICDSGGVDLPWERES